MKRLYQSAKWKRHSRKRQRAEERARLRFKGVLRRRRRVAEGKRREDRGGQKQVRLVAPRVFSVRANPDELTSFCRQMQHKDRRGRSIFIDLSEVTELEPDALAMLVARVRNLPTQIAGNLPDDPILRGMVMKSGFLDHVRTPLKTSGAPSGLMVHKKGLKVNPSAAKALIGRVTGAATGAAQRRPLAYRALIECMSNTFDHASAKRDGDVEWWATAYYDETTRIGHYAFVDVGVGVFRSVRVRGIRRVLQRIGLGSNTTVLQLMLKGEIPSRTGLPYRGKGLPSIYRAACEGRLRNVVLVSNDVFGDFSQGEFRTLRYPFNGTLLRWEVTE